MFSFLSYFNALKCAKSHIFELLTKKMCFFSENLALAFTIAFKQNWSGGVDKFFKNNPCKMPNVIKRKVQFPLVKKDSLRGGCPS